MEKAFNKFGRSQAEQKEFATQVGQKIYTNICDKKIKEKFVKITEEIALLACDYLEALQNENEEDMSIEGIIAANLGTFPKESFVRWGDRNNISSVSPSYFDKNGRAIDVQAAGIIEDYNLFLDEKEVIEEIINFVMTYRKGTYKSYWKLKKQELSNQFITLVGFEPKDYYCTHLINQFFGVKKATNDKIDKGIFSDDNFPECPF